MNLTRIEFVCSTCRQKTKVGTGNCKITEQKAKIGELLCPKCKNGKLKKS